MLIAVILSVPQAKWVEGSVPDSIKSIVQTVYSRELLSSAIFLVVIFALSLVNYAILQWARSRILIEKVSAQPVGLSLALEKNEACFDKYLDEIQYFFKRMRKTIVVFEDLDRFDNPQIFDDLRSLNQILNNSLSSRKWFLGRMCRHSRWCSHSGVRFIYAVKDEIFSKSVPHVDECAESSELELRDLDSVRLALQGAGRTKFFDLIIPVFPFATSANLRALLKESLGDEVEKLDGLLQIVQHYLLDGRFIRNVCNEYQLALRVLPQVDRSNLGRQQLFAILVYKGLYPHDFEQIRLGSSDLNRFFETFDVRVKEIVCDLRRLLSDVEERIHVVALTSKGVDILMKAFEKHVKEEKAAGREVSEILRILEMNPVTAPEEYYREWSISDINQEKFWRAVFESSDRTIYYYFYYDVDNEVDEGCVDLNELLKLVGLTFANYNDPLSSRNELEKTRLSIENALRKLKDICVEDAHPQLPGVDLLDTARLSVSDIAKDTLRSSLARELVLEGFITKDFLLSSSILFEGRAGERTSDFLGLDCEDVEDRWKYVLDQWEVGELLAWEPVLDWSSSRLLNFSILAALLSENGARLFGDDARNACEGIRQLLKLDRQLMSQFSQAYLSANTQGLKEFVKWITPIHSKIFREIASLPNDRLDRSQLFNVALQVMDETICYEGGGQVIEVVDNDLHFLGVATGEVADGDVPAILRYLQENSSPFKDLRGLRPELQKAALFGGHFVENRENFEAFYKVVNGRLTIDLLSGLNGDFLAVVVRHLDWYCEWFFSVNSPFSEGPFLVPKPETFRAIEVEAEAQAQDPASVLSRLLACCRNTRTGVSSWRIEELEEVNEEFWGYLAQFGRIEPNERNILDLLKKVDFNPQVVSFLKGVESIMRSKGFTEQERSELRELLSGAPDGLNKDVVRRLLDSLRRDVESTLD